ncbi:ABC transporter substrate-binding protein [Alsobacter metallidurans]|uniref:ABC transporter substrate-binding protein n=1 Tax=Alsobacter metallidurans TaxID=340221 RepID=A0A917MHZ8_9HYPH|nr:extracellular solute-binding protein [Alsobacter metallidurans]GGH20730.1 ABC transporter substrate-binding protein [Alsobacter metallidurans]
MTEFKLSRRGLMGAAAGLATLGTNRAFAQLAMPKDPVTLNIVDVAGNLALTQKAFEAYRKAKPNVVSKFTFTKAPAPELPGKIKAQQDAGRLDIDMVLTGTDALAAGIQQGLWLDLLGQHAAALPKLDDIYLKGAAMMQTLARGQGVVCAYYPSGPLLEYMPDKVKTAPTSVEELLAFTKQNPNKFLYARPANSGPGRTFMMGLPYILGDSNPKDPMKGWDKTWAYLKELGQNIEYYPTGTGATMKELGEGTRDIIVSTTGWDINPRVLGVVPKEAKITTLKNFRWVIDAHYMVVPKGLSNEKVAVLLDVMKFMLGKEAQAYTYDEGYFYPGPAVKDVPLSMAPAESQAAIKEFGRPEYEKLIAEVPLELPLEPEPMVAAFRRWDEEIGSKKTK